MLQIQDFIPPNIGTSEKDSVIVRSELKKMGAHHPALSTIKIIVQSTFRPAFFSAIFLILFIKYNWVGLRLICVSLFFYVAAALLEAVFQTLQVKLNRAHVFLGYRFSNVDSMLEVPKPIAELTAFIWPTWGITSLLPPMPNASQWGKFREQTKFRGTIFPFTYRTDTVSNWQTAVLYFLSKASVAVFDLRYGVTSGLDFEMRAADEILGRDKVIRISRLGNIDVVTIGKEIVDVPAGIEDMEAPNLSEENFVTCAKVRWAVARTVTIDRTALRSRNMFSRAETIKLKTNLVLFLLSITCLVLGIFSTITSLLGWT